MKLTQEQKFLLKTKKHNAYINVCDNQFAVHSYWDGGSRDEWFYLYDNGKLESIPAPTAPPQFGGNPNYCVVATPNRAILKLGTFLGKPATPSLTIHSEWNKNKTLGFYVA